MTQNDKCCNIPEDDITRAVVKFENSEFSMKTASISNARGKILENTTTILQKDSHHGDSSEDKTLSTTAILTSVGKTEKRANEQKLSGAGSVSVTALATLSTGSIDIKPMLTATRDITTENQLFRRLQSEVKLCKSSSNFDPWIPLMPQSSVTKQVAVKSSVKFNLASSINFFSDTEAEQDGAKHLHYQSTQAKLVIKKESANVTVGLKTDPQRPKTFKDLEKTLEHILPFEIHYRILEDRKRCVATLALSGSRCGAKINGTAGNANAKMKAMSDCIAQSDYFNLPVHIHALVASTMCKRHQNVALSQPMKKARIEVLTDLIVLLPQETEDVLSLFENWLEAISNSCVLALYKGPGDLPAQTTWTRSLTIMLGHIMPVRMQARVERNPARCVVLRCKELHSSHIHGSSNQRGVVSGHIERISQCIRNSQYVALPDHFESLIQAVMCYSHRKVATSKLAMLRAIASNMAYISHQNLPVLRAWLEAIAKCDIPPITQASADHRVSSSSTTTALVATRKVSVKAGTPQTTLLPNFTSYRAERSSDSELSEALRSKIQKNLSETDRNDGFIYIFWDQKHFGKVKIGRTNNLNRRLREWDRQCKTKHRYHRTQDGKPMTIPHVQRIEHLIHRELVNYRMKRACEACGTNHDEWFDINERQARKVAEKWRNWIMQKPYEMNVEGFWTLKPEMLETLDEVCKPTIISENDVKTVGNRPRLAKDRTKRRASRKTL